MSGITVGIDGSAHSSRALEWALSEGATRHAPVTVLTVHSVPMSGWTGNPIKLPRDAADLDRERQAAEELTAKALSQLGDAQPPSVTVRAIIGFPAEELVEASRTADLMVVGSRGAGGFARLVIGLGQQPGRAPRPLPSRRGAQWELRAFPQQARVSRSVRPGRR